MSQTLASWITEYLLHHHTKVTDSFSTMVTWMILESYHILLIHYCCVFRKQSWTSICLWVAGYRRETVGLFFIHGKTTWCTRNFGSSSWCTYTRCSKFKKILFLYFADRNTNIDVLNNTTMPIQTLTTTIALKNIVHLLKPGEV